MRCIPLPYHPHLAPPLLSATVQLNCEEFDRKTNTLRAWHGCLPPGIWRSPGTLQSHSLYRTKSDTSKVRGCGESEGGEGLWCSVVRAGTVALNRSACARTARRRATRVVTTSRGHVDGRRRRGSPSTAHVPPSTPRLHSALLLWCAQEL